MHPRHLFPHPLHVHCVDVWCVLCVCVCVVLCVPGRRLHNGRDAFVLADWLCRCLLACVPSLAFPPSTCLPHPSLSPSPWCTCLPASSDLLGFACCLSPAFQLAHCQFKTARAGSRCDVLFLSSHLVLNLPSHTRSSPGCWSSIHPISLISCFESKFCVHTIPHAAMHPIHVTCMHPTWCSCSRLFYCC